MDPETYHQGLLAERDNSVRAGRTEHVALVDAEIKANGFPPVETATSRKRVEKR